MDCVEYARHLRALYETGWRIVIMERVITMRKGQVMLARYLDSDAALAVALAAEGVPFIDYSS